MKRVLAGILAICMLFSMAGCKSKTSAEEKEGDSQSFLDSKAEVFIKDIPYPGDVETGLIDTHKIADIFKESSEKYLWYKVNTEAIDEECSLYALGKDTFKSKIEDKAIEDEINTYSDTTVRREELSTIEANALSIFDGYLNRGEANRYKGYFEAPFSAFNGQVIAGTEYSPDEFLKKNGLDLYFRNPKLLQIVSSEILAESMWLVTAKVSVTVDCYENSGMFKDIKWIPKKGMESDVTFAVTYMSYYTKDTDLHEIQVYDLCVVD